MPKFTRTKKYFWKNVEIWQRWLDYKKLKTNANYISEGFVHLITPSPREDNDEFEKTVKKLNLSDEQLTNKLKQLVVQCGVYLGLGLGVFLYGCFRLTHAHYFSFFVCTLLMLMMFTFAFRAHFWRYQIKSRRLGCTSQEWLAAVLRGEV